MRGVSIEVFRLKNKRRKKTRKRKSTFHYRIPKKDNVFNALKTVFTNLPVIESQRKLRTLVEGLFNEQGEEFRISDKRVRKLAIESGIIQVEVLFYRELKAKTPLYLCPICDSKIKPVKNLTLENTLVVTGYVCDRCGYSTGLKRRVPVKYIFHIKKG